jgi:hypothetical protein
MDHGVALNTEYSDHGAAIGSKNEVISILGKSESENRSLAS